MWQYSLKINLKTALKNFAHFSCLALGAFAISAYAQIAPSTAQLLSPNVIPDARLEISKINQREASALIACNKEFQTNACKARVKQQFSGERNAQQKLIIDAQRAVREQRAAQANERVGAGTGDTDNRAGFSASDPKQPEIFVGKPRRSEQEQAIRRAKAQERFAAKQKRIAERAAKREAKLNRPPKVAREPKK